MKPAKITAISIFLVCILIFGLYSCKTDGTGSPDPTGAGEVIPEAETTTEIKDSLPDDLEFGGETLNVYTFASGMNGFDIEVETGDLVNDAFYRRVMHVEERLDIKINRIYDDLDWNDGKPVTKIRASMAAGDHAFDVIGGWCQKLTAFSTEGLLMNLYDVEYLDLSQPWWNQGFNTELNIGGKLNFASGDIYLYFIQNINCITFNKTLASECGLPDLYKVVADGKWTLDYMNEVVKDTYKDLNGDGTKDKEDQYGIYMCFDDDLSAFNVGADATLIKIGPDGYPQLSPDIERLAGFVEKMYVACWENPNSFMGDGATRDQMWKDGRSIMRRARLFDAAVYYKDILWDYGIIPLPKYDESQAGYHSGIGNLVPMMCVPKNCEKTELVGAFMEAFAFYGYKNITPVFFDIVLDIKTARDDESLEMLNIIKDGSRLTFDIINNNLISNAGMFIVNMMQGKNRDFVSWYDKNNEKITNTIDKMVAKMNENG